MTDAIRDQAADAAIHDGVKVVGDVSTQAVREMTERMASLVADSAARYFNGDTKAALAAQAMLLRQMAAGRDVQDPTEILVMDQSLSQVPSQG